MKLSIAIAAALLSTAVYAQDTEYEYTGTPMNVQTSYVSGNYVPTELLGSLILANPLNPNEANQIVTPLSYSFASEQSELSQNAQSNQQIYQTVGSFEFSTVNGAITGWNVDITANTLGTNTAIAVQGSTYNGPGGAYDSYSAYLYAPYCGMPGTPGCFSVSGASNVAGTWIDPPLTNTVSAPELGSNWTVFLTILGGLLLVIRGRSKRPLLAV